MATISAKTVARRSAPDLQCTVFNALPSTHCLQCLVFRARPWRRGVPAV